MEARFQHNQEGEKKKKLEGNIIQKEENFRKIKKNLNNYFGYPIEDKVEDKESIT